MPRKPFYFLAVVVLMLTTLACIQPVAHAVTQATPTQSAELEAFKTAVINGTPGEIVGIYVGGVFSLPVVPQPGKDNTYVSPDLGVATLFRSAKKNGIIGLIAHNYLSGKLFYQLKTGQEVVVIYGDGTLEYFSVTESSQFQKVVPNSLRSPLIDLETSKERSTNEVFNEYYNGDRKVVFQTCLEKEGLSNWGLTFWVAEPLERK